MFEEQELEESGRERSENGKMFVVSKKTSRTYFPMLHTAVLESGAWSAHYPQTRLQAAGSTRPGNIELSSWDNRKSWSKSTIKYLKLWPPGMI